MSETGNYEGDILRRINELVTEEHDLRQQSEHRLTTEERQRMRELEESLDQCWDLLRRRRARAEYGRDSAGEAPPPPTEAEHWR